MCTVGLVLLTKLCLLYCTHCRRLGVDVLVCVGIERGRVKPHRSFTLVRGVDFTHGPFFALFFAHFNDVVAPVGPGGWPLLPLVLETCYCGHFVRQEHLQSTHSYGIVTM